MAESNDYLKYFITEDVYIVAEEPNVGLETTSSQTSQSVTSEVAQAKAETPIKVDTEVSKTEELTKKTPVIEQPKIDLEKTEPKEPQEITTNVKPEKRLIVVYDYKESEALPVPLKQLMLKILEAVRVKIPDADFVNTSFKPAPKPLSYYENCIVFSLTSKVYAEELKSLSTYNIATLQKTKVLKADSLENLNNDINLKKQLWKMLQTMFPKN
jgi:DNA polymerase III psi subunit